LHLVAIFLVIYLSLKQLYQQKCLNGVLAFTKVAERRSGTFQLNLSTGATSLTTLGVCGKDT